MPSLRFQTTTQNALKESASRWNEADTAFVMAQKRDTNDIENRRRTFISFGTNGNDYVTESSEQQQAILGAAAKNIHEESAELKKLKLRLTRENFTLGDKNSNMEYELTSTLPDPADQLHVFKGKLPPDIEKSFKSRGTSIFFGSDKVSYESMMRRAYTIQNGTKQFEELTLAANHLKRQNTSHNFSFQHHEVSDWTTDYRSRFVSYTPQQQTEVREVQTLEEMKRDLRMSHFSLAHSSPVPSSSSSSLHRRDDRADENKMRTQMEAVHNMSVFTNRDAIMENRASALLVERLRKTNFVIGNDPDYM